MTTLFLNRLGEIDFSHTIERLVEGFIGREWLFEKLDNWLNQEDGEKFYLLTGEPGVGKSAIAARLTQRWTDSKPETGKLAAYHFCRAGDVETVRPGRVVRSLATQLVNTLPGYKEALKEVIDPVYLNITSEINIGTLSNSQVTGIYVENLKNLDPREEFRLLIQAPLAALSNIYASLGETPPSVKVFLIDSLDEAATTTGQENMVTLLASLYQARLTLPPWIRFLLTARPDQSVLTRFLPLKSEKIEELEAKNLSDIEKYIQGRVDDQLRAVQSTPEPQINNALVSNLKPLQQRLEEADLTAKKLVGEVKELSHGNFLYTKLLLNSIESGEQSIKNLSALPKNLNDIYHRILRYRCSFRGWLKRYQPILGALSIAQESITLEQLTKFIGIKPEELKQDLEIFQQFLDQSEDDQGKPAYSIFHQSLREYLLDKQNHDFWCDAREQHENIINYFENESKQWQDLEAIDLYGLRHLAQHLVKGNRVEELHLLLSLEKNRRNAWFKVKDEEGDTSGFLADIELAWTQADDAFDREPGKSIGLQCRYALIKASTNRLTEIPTSLMLTLVKRKYWKPVKALAITQQVLNPKLKLANLLAISTQLPTTEPLRLHILGIAVQVTKAMPDESARVEALSDLVEELPPELLPQALDIAQSIEYELDRAKALTILVPHQPELLPQALSTIRSIHPEELQVRCVNEEWQFNAFKELVGKLPPEVFSSQFSQVLKVAQSIQRKVYRDIALETLAEKLPSKLPPNLLSQAVNAIQSIQDKTYRSLALGSLAKILIPDLLSQAREVAQSIQDEVCRDRTLSSLVRVLIPEQLSHALDIAQSIQLNAYRVEALTALLPHQPELTSKVLNAIQSTQDEQLRYQSIVNLAKQLPQELSSTLQTQVFDIIQSIQDEVYRAKALIALLPHQPKLLAQVLDEIQPLQDEYRASMLYSISDKLSPDLLFKAIEIAQSIECGKYRVAALMSLLPHQSTLIPDILEAIQSIEDEYRVPAEPRKAQALYELGEQLPSELSPDLLSYALKVAKSFRQRDYRNYALTGLALNLSLHLLPEILLVATQSVQEELYQCLALITLAKKLSPELSVDLLSQALKIVQSIQDDEYRGLILAALAEFLPELSPELLSQALNIVQSIQDEQLRVELLAALTVQQRDIVCIALNAIQQTQDNFRSRTLVSLAENVPANLTFEQFSQVLVGVQSIGEERLRSQALKALADKLPSTLLSQAYEIAQSIKDDYYRVSATAPLPGKLTSELLPQAYEEAQGIPSWNYRTQALINLGEKLSPDLLPQFLEMIKSIPEESIRLEVQIALSPNRLHLFKSIQNEFYRTQALFILVPHQPELLTQALLAIKLIENEISQIELLTKLAAKLSPEISFELLSKAYEIAQSMQDKSDQFEALSILAERQPELCQAVKMHSLQPELYQDLEIVPIMGAGSGEYLLQALSTLGSIFFDARDGYILWKSSLHSLSSFSRPDLCFFLAYLAYAIKVLGSEVGVAETAQAVQVISRWWP